MTTFSEAPVELHPIHELPDAVQGPQVVIVSRSIADAKWLRTSRGSTPAGADILHTLTVEEAVALLRPEAPSCVILGFESWEQGLDDLARLAEAEPRTPIIVLTDAEDDERAIEAIRLGAQDVVARFRLRNGDRLRNTITFAIERQLALARREASEIRYRTAFDQAPVGMAVIARDGIVLQVNRSLGEILHRDEASLIGIPMLDVFVAADVEEDIGNAGFVDWLLAKQGAAELRLPRSDGRLIWGLVQTVIIPDQHGRFCHVLLQVEDVTDKRRAKEQLEELVAHQDQGLRQAEALAACARTLLASSDEGQAADAINALVDVVEATSIFVARNVQHPELGLAAQLTHAGSADRRSDALAERQLVAWDAMPDTYAQLSRGKPFAFVVDELGPVERAIHGDDPDRSELTVPIIIGSRWAGMLGVVDDRRRHGWTAAEVRVLSAAADMIGAFWRRTKPSPQR